MLMPSLATRCSRGVLQGHSGIIKEIAMNKRKKGVFISYRRIDSIREAEILEQQLAKLGYQVFRDVSNIEVAERFPEKIKNALEEADFIFVIIGRKWLEAADDKGQRRLDDARDFVRREVSYALRRLENEHQVVHVIPILVQNAKMPQSSALPHDLKALAQINAPHINPKTFEADVTRLMSKLDELHEDKLSNVLDALDRDLGPGPMSVSLKPIAADNPELHDFPELATWKCTIGKHLELRFTTKEDGFFEGELLKPGMFRMFKPRGVRIEGTWQLGFDSGRRFVMKLAGTTFGGEGFEVIIPIERKAGERSYSGRSTEGEYVRMEWLSRGEDPSERF